MCQVLELRWTAYALAGGDFALAGSVALVICHCSGSVVGCHIELATRTGKAL